MPSCLPQSDDRTQLPTENDINVHDSLDEITAAQHFLGKSRGQAALLFAENSLTYYEDLMWMGPVAFNFYICSAFDYLKSDSSTGDSDFINGLLIVLEFRMHRGSSALDRRKIAQLIDEIVSNYEKFRLDPSVYGDLRGKFLKLRPSISE
jgi:hypothetical protein